MGTSGRVCSVTEVGKYTEQDEDKCNQLCVACGHHIRNKSRLLEWQCNCQFHWCCKVTCDICSKEVEEHYCEKV